MATGTKPNVMAIQNLTSGITAVSGLMSTSDVQLYRIGNMALFNFRFKPVSGTPFPVAVTKTYTLPISPKSNTRISVPKTNAAGACSVTINTNGEVTVYAYDGAYSDWVIGQIFFLVA